MESDRYSAGITAFYDLFKAKRWRALASIELVLSRRRISSALAARLKSERDDADAVMFPDWLLAEVASGTAQRSIIDGQTAMFTARRNALNGQAAILGQRMAQMRYSSD